MRKLCAMVFISTLAAASPILAFDLQGKWQFTGLVDQGGHYSGTIIIDRKGEARLKGTSKLQDFAECGVVAPAGSKVEIVFKIAQARYGYAVDHFYCTVLNSSALDCYNIDAQGKRSFSNFAVLRVGDIPISPADRLEGICAPREKPLS
jgi:hypothetical protein